MRPPPSCSCRPPQLRAPGRQHDPNVRCPPRLERGERAGHAESALAGDARDQAGMSEDREAVQAGALATGGAVASAAATSGARSVPRTSVDWLDSVPPVACTSAVAAPGTGRPGAVPRHCRTASTIMKRPYMPGCTRESPPPLAFTGRRPADRDRCTVQLDAKPDLAQRADRGMRRLDEHVLVRHQRGSPVRISPRGIRFLNVINVTVTSPPEEARSQHPTVSRS